MCNSQRKIEVNSLYIVFIVVVSLSSYIGIGALKLKRNENQRYVIELMVHLPFMNGREIISFSTSGVLI